MYALATIVMKASSLLMLPYIAGSLSPEQFGQLELLATFATLISVIAGFALEDSLFRFCGIESSHSKQKMIARAIYRLALKVSLAFFAIGITVSPWITALAPSLFSAYLLKLIILMLACEALIAVPLAWLRMNEHVLLYCFICIAKTVIQALLVWQLLERGRALDGIFEATALSTVLAATALFFIHINSTGFIATDNNTVNDGYKLDKSVLLYALPIVGSGLLAFFTNGFDRWVLLGNTNLEQIACYAIAAKFALALSIALQPYGMWWSPIRFSIFEKERKEINNKVHSTDSPRRYKNTDKYSNCGCIQALLFMLALSLFAPIAIQLLFDSSYHGAIYFVPMMLCIAALKELCEYSNIGCLINKSSTTQFHISLLTTALAIVAMLFLSRHYQVHGVLAALAMAQALRMFLLNHFTQRYTGFSLPVARLTTALGICLALAIYNAQSLAQKELASLMLISQNSIFILKLLCINVAAVLFIIALYFVKRRDGINEFEQTRQP
ncbi:lipopolysaccharide biosynthesis protein [Agaribacterium haliotis]|uniref:lipopolysaccharide biosynthesis protein n=1 Tax=Agaribacterium haliotis TaxID=2013869 RepID=UPI0023D8773E|nr:oligosaccharide flippase family protein [Agaribacterium haliotis]